MEKGHKIDFLASPRLWHPIFANLITLGFFHHNRFLSLFIYFLSFIFFFYRSSCSVSVIIRFGDGGLKFLHLESMYGVYKCTQPLTSIEKLSVLVVLKVVVIWNLLWSVLQRMKFLSIISFFKKKASLGVFMRCFIPFAVFKWLIVGKAISFIVWCSLF